ncbi:MAG: peptidoglycan glycosyltransferase, cell division protein FtsI (penicillin-binding protein 3) [Chloroflexi bacterium CSP1-4]|nr:MAG: peptidoglycan glycosyltransferase, cell division protein FtsI (penicillin-binding protein 3) [Chloroflexi bacterium CSP1-4]
MLGRTDRRPRLVILLVFVVLGAAALGARLAYWQVVRGAELRDDALAQLERAIKVPVQRGEIYDRSGTIVLATTGYRDLLAAYPKRIPAADKAAVADELVAILDLEGAAAEKLRTTIGGAAEYAVLAQLLTQGQSEDVSAGLADGRLLGLELDPQPIRIYPSQGGAPATTLASQLLGFTNREGEGQYGIEQRYQDLLAGRPRIVTALRDVAGRPIADSERAVDTGAPGADLVLTIDAGLQLQLEKELYAAWVADRAQTVSAVVMDPQTGEILAWASVPGYDANEYQRVAKEDPGLFLDPVVGAVYEPGSVMKMYVAAAAYEADVVTPQTRINDSGSLRIGRSTIWDSDKRAMGRMAFEDGIAYSRNIVAARVARMLGPDVRSAAASLYDIWARLGIGRATGVDTSGELPGLVVDPAVKRWAEIDLANRSFGQGVAVTQLQLATSFSTMVNGGYRVTPYLVDGIGGERLERPPAEPVIDAQLSAELTDLMTHVVTSVPWYAEGTLIPGYAVGGKTGTAQIWDGERQDWMPLTFNFSFVGFVGQDGPDAVIAVRIGDTRPKVIRQGELKLSITSFELFRRIALDTIDVLGIPPAEASRRDDLGR